MPPGKKCKHRPFCSGCRPTGGLSVQTRLQCATSEDEEDQDHDDGEDDGNVGGDTSDHVDDDDEEENVQTRLQCATSGAENGENPTKNGYLRPTPLSWMIPPRPKDKINLFFPSVYPNIHRICFCPAI